MVSYRNKSIPIVFVVLDNGDEKVKAFSLVPKLVIVAYVDDAVAVIS